MKRKRILSFLGIIALVFIGGMISLILFPQPLFSHSYEYKEFEIYSDYKLNKASFNKAIDEAILMVKKSELNDPAYNYDIFLANKTIFNKLDNLVLGKWSVARAISNNVIIKREVDEIERIVDNDQNQFDLVYVLAHEMIHCLQCNKYGIWKFNPIKHPPFWKLEGYPEYIARRPLLESKEYNLRKGINDFLIRTADNDDRNQIIQISENESSPFLYYKGRLMIEYLMDIKKMTYDEILDEAIKEEKVYSEMINWYEEKQIINLESINK